MKQLDLLKNLVIMASADGSLAEREIALLVDRCKQLGLGEKDMEEAIAFALSSEAAMKLPTDHAEQIAMLSDLIRVMAADGSLSDAEKRLFSLAAAKMEIDRDEIEELIDNLVGPHKAEPSPNTAEINSTTSS